MDKNRAEQEFAFPSRGLGSRNRSVSACPPVIACALASSLAGRAGVREPLQARGLWSKGWNAPIGNSSAFEAATKSVWRDRPAGRRSPLGAVGVMRIEGQGDVALLHEVRRHPEFSSSGMCSSVPLRS